MIYADRVYNPKFNSQPIVKPLLTPQASARQPKVRYIKFGVNLGPKSPVRSVDKYAKQPGIV